jgi:hypothetical protein
MSRTRHRRVDRSNKRTPRSRLTKGKGAGEYSPSTLDEPANRGLPGSWSLWLHSYNGYGKQRKRRRIRKRMKTYGRRVCRRSQHGEVLGAEAAT